MRDRLLAAIFVLLGGLLGAQEQFARVAATQALELYINDETSQIIVMDLRDGSRWRSNPSLVDEPPDRLPEFWQSAFFYPFIISYVGSEMLNPLVLNLRFSQPSFQISPLDGGVAVDYEVSIEIEEEVRHIGYTETVTTKGALAFRIEYRLVEDRLIVHVPQESMRESGDFHWVSLELLPLLGANPASSGGFLFVPDGSGMLMPYAESRMDAFHLVQPMYGVGSFQFELNRRIIGSELPEDLARFRSRFDVTSQPARLPVFGMVRDGAGFLGVVTAGATDLRMQSSLAGFILDYNRVGPSFIFRYPYRAYLSRSRNLERFTMERVDHDLEVEYTFLPAPGTGYDQLVGAYRRHLERRLEPPRRDYSALVRVFCGVSEQGLVLDQYYAMTTFKQIESMIVALADRGATDYAISIVGWERGGYESRLPDHFPIERRLGGERGLRELVEAAAGYGIDVFLEIDYFQAFAGSGRFSASRDVVLLANELPITDGEGAYILSPSFVLSRIDEDAAEFERLGVTGVILRHYGTELFPDYSRFHPMQRSEMLDAISEIVSRLRRRGLAVMMSGGNAYSLELSDGVLGAPTRSSRYLEPHVEVPFYQNALRDVVPIYDGPLNLRSDVEEALARARELGTRPVFEVTHESPVLIRRTRYNHLFSSQFSYWVDTIAQAITAEQQPGESLAEADR